MHDVEAAAGDEPGDGGRGAPPRIEQDLQRTPVADEHAGERRHRAEHSEGHDDQVHPERLDFRAESRGRRPGQQRAARDVVRRGK